MKNLERKKERKKERSCVFKLISSILMVSLALSTFVFAETETLQQNDLVATAYLIDKDGNVVPVEAEITIEEVFSTVQNARTALKAPQYKITATVDTHELANKTSSSDSKTGVTLDAKVTATIFYTNLGFASYRLDDIYTTFYEGTGVHMSKTVFYGAGTGSEQYTIQASGTSYSHTNINSYGPRAQAMVTCQASGAGASETLVVNIASPIA